MNDQVQVLDGMGVIRPGFIKLDDKPDKTGLIRVQTPEGKVIKVNPKRIKNGGTTGSVAVGTIATCPTCQKVCDVEGAAGKCTCGDFNIAAKVEQEKPTTPQEPQPESEDLLGHLISLGELWGKESKFDHESTKVMSCTLRIGDRCTSFNLYNGTYGRKANKPPIDELLTGKEHPKISKIDDIEKWRKALAIGKLKEDPKTKIKYRDPYKLLSPPETST